MLVVGSRVAYSGYSVIGSRFTSSLPPCAQIDLSHNQLCGLDENGYGTYTAEGIKAIASAISVNASLTYCNVLESNIDNEAAQMLVKVVEHKDISLAGLQPEQTTFDFYNIELKSSDLILLASDLSKRSVSGSLTSIDISHNSGMDQNIKVIDLLKERELISIGLEGCADRRHEIQDVADYISVSVCHMLNVNASLTCIEIGGNSIRNWGAKHVAEGISVSTSLTKVLVYWFCIG